MAVMNVEGEEFVTRHIRRRDWRGGQLITVPPQIFYKVIFPKIPLLFFQFFDNQATTQFADLF